MDIFPLKQDLVMPFSDGAFIQYPADVFAITYKLGEVSAREKLLNLQLQLVKADTGRLVVNLKDFQITAEGFDGGTATNQEDINKALEEKAKLADALSDAVNAEQAARLELARLQSEDPGNSKAMDIEVNKINDAIGVQKEKRSHLENFFVPVPVYDKSFTFDQVVGFFTNFALNEIGLQAAMSIPFNGHTIGYYIAEAKSKKIK